MRTAKAFFPGKVIVSGEHSVVYGEKALVASLNIGIEAIVSEGKLDKQWQKNQYLQEIIKIFEKFSGLKSISFALEINSNLPQKSGLGSSAAFAATIIQALVDFYQIKISKEELFKLTLEAENLIHSNSSGVDPAIVINPGLLIYQKLGAVIKMEQLCSSFNTNFFLIDSGKAIESTGEMVKKVSQEPKSKQVIKKIGKTTENIIASFKNNDFKPSLLDDNEEYLEELGVVGEKAQQMIRFLRANGAYAKITGAGGCLAGSGYILAWHENIEKFSKILESQAMKFFLISLGNPC